MKLGLAILLGKIIFFISRNFKIGGGSAAPGYYALKLYPEIVTELSKNISQNIVITGTNGKTTTARILAHLTKANNLKVIRNSTGSNLERGIASALIEKASIFNGLKDIDVAIWEIDEAAFNKVVSKIRPQIIVFLNVYRDQLDRYGEVDSIVKKWVESLEKLNWEPLIIVNLGDEILNPIAFRNNVCGYLVENHSIKSEALASKNNKQKRADFSLKIIKNHGLSGNEFMIEHPSGKVLGMFNTPGIYNLYNLLAAFSVYYHLNLGLGKFSEILKSFLGAFGRLERFKIEGKEAYIFLIKNPTGADQVFETVSNELKKGDKLLLALNDNFADGKDVSWIWDANWEVISPSTGSGSKDHQLSDIRIVCSGERAEDLALRLKYAGFNIDNIEIEKKLEHALESSKKGLNGRLFILLTYTAMLELQAILAKRGIKKHYWRES